MKMCWLFRGYVNVNFEVYERVTTLIELFQVFSISLKSTSYLSNRYLRVWKCVSLSDVTLGDILEVCINLDLTSH